MGNENENERKKKKKLSRDGIRVDMFCVALFKYHDNFCLHRFEPVVFLRGEQGGLAINRFIHFVLACQEKTPKKKREKRKKEETSGN